MPDVFEKFFADFGKKPSDYYELEKLTSAYQVSFDVKDSITIPGSLEEIYDVFEKEEKGSAAHLKSFLKSAESKTVAKRIKKVSSIFWVNFFD